MILLTGGAGCIGSNLHAALARRGLEVVIVDRLRAGGKWRNLAHHPPAQILPPADLPDFLDGHPPIETIFHLGAVTDTAAREADLVWESNVALPLSLWEWCALRGVRFIYASSAATYGDGAAGFEDDPDPAALARLRPLSLYGWSKHAFDLQVARLLAGGAARPPQWVGLKFFNVYGPNEYHKGAMISVVKVKFDELVQHGVMRLFRSGRPDIPDGAQRRDFIWVGDVVDVLLWLLDRPDVNGLYNLGTGGSATYLALAEAVAAAAGREAQIEFVDMPDALAGQYQYRTEAAMRRLRAAGYAGPFLPLAEGVRRYVKEFLATADPYR
ncbi:MAG TPA: ADP-glyceromanno-heptose 6-epimerase [Acetobacteraceae bacterium]|jgi:ADP-L-glycero-D-manno-heptose 6-epimerase|nr:ADP-glyceromanno-heptose 6-epimerase [Acetobacteraceae bacterium]